MEPLETWATSPDAPIARRLRRQVRDAAAQLAGDATPSPERLRALVRDTVEAYQRDAALLNHPLIVDEPGLCRQLEDALLGLDLLQPLLDSPAVEEILVNGPRRLFVIEDGRKRYLSHLAFDSDDDLRALVKRLVGAAGGRLDEASPMVDLRLPDGSRLNAAIPPVTPGYCAVSIRKFRLRAHTLADLVELGTLPGETAAFLEAAVQAGANILVSGATGAGKTTFLNALGAAIASEDERVISIEEVGELQLSRQLPDCVSLVARAGNIEGVGAISIRDLVRQALRMRPTRIVVGEVRGAEALDMLQAMNTGHDGSLTTIHANSPRDALERLVTLASMAPEKLPAETLGRMVARTIDLVVQLRFEPRSGGRATRAGPSLRRVTAVFEVSGLTDGLIAGNDLWQTQPGREAGTRLVWSGIRPRLLERMAERGIAYTPPLSKSPEWKG